MGCFIYKPVYIHISKHICVYMNIYSMLMMRHNYQMNIHEPTVQFKTWTLTRVAVSALCSFLTFSPVLPCLKYSVNILFNCSFGGFFVFLFF